ncbi:hypothetical protein M422DRAFT_275460 [Sphaerobolus stellatus SS14]|uniref:Uncharacterized protein n=1 Tax=Sphaerobolus stellatus (strain SS14) TaxID=990650 RepID=A0A0C9T4U5_SPHS4|nr:hypothetical protein M422DRAFT_275460 [Sphaerobolus stellatus SS14]
MGGRKKPWWLSGVVPETREREKKKRKRKNAKERARELRSPHRRKSQADRLRGYSSEGRISNDSFSG